MGMFDEEEVDKNRLFETHQKSSRSFGQYLKILLIVAAGVILVGAVIFYVTLPGVGDKVRAPAGLEDGIRDHLLVKEKRTATDITVYYCGTFYSASADVETRPDIPGTPINRISRYKITAIQAGSGEWNVTAAPVTGSDEIVACK